METVDPERPRPAADPTGDPRVDAAVERLASIGELDLAQRPAVLQDVHDRLREILGELGGTGAPGTGVPDPGAWPGEPGRPGQQAELG
jgi:hypothetical protein